MDIKEDYNLRENADITYLAMRCAESKDPTELKKWFDAKYNTTDKVNDAKTEKEECTLHCVGESLWCVLVEKNGFIIDSHKNEEEAIERCNGLNKDYNGKVIVKKYISE